MLGSREQPWPPPQPIAPSARTSAFAVAACLALAGVATVALAWNELTCRAAVYTGPERSAPDSVCDILAGVGGVASMLGIAAVVGGVAIVRNVRRREVSERGADGWRWVLGVMFTIGLLVLATRLPEQTCPAGARLDGLFRLCIDDAAGARFDSTSWIWARSIVAIAAPILGLGVIARRRLAAVAVPLTIAAWGAGIGWLLLDTVGREWGG